VPAPPLAPRVRQRRCRCSGTSLAGLPAAPPVADASASLARAARAVPGAAARLARFGSARATSSGPGLRACGACARFAFGRHHAELAAQGCLCAPGGVARLDLRRPLTPTPVAGLLASVGPSEASGGSPTTGVDVVHGPQASGPPRVRRRSLVARAGILRVPIMRRSNRGAASGVDAGAVELPPVRAGSTQNAQSESLITPACAADSRKLS